MMVGNGKMARYVGIRSRTGFRPMPTTGRKVSAGPRSPSRASPRSRLSHMSCQGGELAEPTAVYECYMHLHKPLVSDRSHLQRRASERTRKARWQHLDFLHVTALARVALLRNMQ